MSSRTAPAPEPAPGSLPRHIGLIMDGNGRWALRRGLPRVMGHRAGIQALRNCVRAAGEAGVACLTVFGFSSENWKRPPTEVSELMGLMRSYVREDLSELHRSGVEIRVIGSRARLAGDIVALIAEAEALTRGNTKLKLTIAFNYGGQDDILEAARGLAHDVAAGQLRPEDITAERFASALSTQGLPDLDLLIRTSGEKRLSNFLIWQSAYAEIIFLDKNWPDFGPADFREALDEFSRRQRKFGAVVPDRP